MTTSYLEDKISDLKARLMAENGAFKTDSTTNEPNPFAGSRPGSGRRPNLLVDGKTTPTRTRKHIDIPGTNFHHQPVNNGIDANLLEQNMKEVMKLSGIMSIDGIKYMTDIEDLELLGELGNGTCGHVVKMLHKPSQNVIAVKQMRRSGNVEESKRIAMDLEVVLKSHDCDYIVHCLGCFVTESDVWICMELMGSCFDKLIKRLVTHVPEPILGKVTLATVKALHYLKENHGVMHRDVKPSNILIDERGNVKLCDFGISGRLVDSKAKSMNAGCAAYMSPERIHPADLSKPDYDIRADVWSLGITLVELATGVFPYPDCNSDFEVLSHVMQDDPPCLPNNGQFSHEFIDFVSSCLVKDYQLRPKYKKLLEHPFIRRYETEQVDVASWYACAVSNQQKQPSRSYKDSKCFCGFKHENHNSNSKEKANSGSSRQFHKTSQEWEKLKGVWNTILKSPLFNRRKKTNDQENTKFNSKEEVQPTRPPVSPLLLQRFLHQQIQHCNAVRPFRSPSQSPTYNIECQLNPFRYDEVLNSEREVVAERNHICKPVRRGASMSPPLHPRRVEFGRQSGRNYCFSPSPNWLVRSKSMTDRSETRFRKRGEDSYFNQRGEMEENANSRVDQLFYRRMKQFNVRPDDQFNQRREHHLNLPKEDVNRNLEDHNKRTEQQFDTSYEDDLYRRFEEQFNLRLDNQIGLSKESQSRKDDQSNLRLDDRLNRNTEMQLNNPVSSGSSPEPPPRINKMISPLLARRIAYNNSLIRDGLMPQQFQSPSLSRRYNFGRQYSMERTEVPSIKSSSLPCSPVLPSRSHAYSRNYQQYNDYTP